MGDYSELMKTLERQEEELQFSEFTNETALKIGLLIIERAKKEGKRITVDIARNGHQLFHYSFDGTSPDNDQWVIRKNRVVNRYYKSSYRMGLLLKSEGKTLEQMLEVSTLDYAAHGGAFPIIIRNVGVVGTITVSGLTQEEDHNMVVSSIREYLGL